MKNIHLITTDKPSRLHEFGDIWFSHKEPKECFRNYNIFITSDEEIKEGDITIYGKSLFLVENILHRSGPFRHLNPEIKIQGRFLPDMTIGKFDSLTPLKKIILTTDQSLNGIQAIDDNFLEWFVKNPSCERVKVRKNPKVHFIEKGKGVKGFNQGYKIIIPQEKPKQEALEEFIKAQPYYGYCTTEYKEGIEAGAKWQEERMGLIEIELRHTKTLLASCEKALEDRDKQAERSYSEEDMIEFAEWIANSKLHGYSKQLYEAMIIYKVKTTKDLLKVWFEQFKKK
jgi:hypothetical protein